MQVQLINDLKLLPEYDLSIGDILTVDKIIYGDPENPQSVSVYLGWQLYIILQSRDYVIIS